MEVKRTVKDIDKNIYENFFEGLTTIKSYLDKTTEKMTSDEFIKTV